MNDLKRAAQAEASAIAERDRVNHGPGSEGQWKRDNAARNASERMNYELELQDERDERAARDADHQLYLAEYEREKRREKRRRSRR